MNILLTSIESIIPIIVIIVLGYVPQNRGWFAESFGANLSRLIMNVALPASIFVSVMKYLTLDKLVSLSGGLLYTFGAFILGYIVAFITVNVFKVRPGRRGTMINTFVNANTIFIGLPLNIALFGENSMPYFLVYYVTNTVSTWVVGIFFIKADDPTKTSNSKTQHLNIKQILPAPLIGFFVAILFLIVGIPIPSFIDQTFTYVGNIVTPLALLYIGIMLFNSKLSSIRFDRDTIVALLGRFILSPLAIIGLLLLGGHLGHGLSVGLKETLIVQSATPALAILPVLAASSHGDTQYATNVVTTSTLLFVFIIPIIMFIMPYIIH